MASVGRVGLSIASDVQETTVALANFGFDFSLIRMDVAPEFMEVGKRLSKKRRVEAEEGQIHVTARKLGSLFAEDVPQVPNLQRAYGLRASQIASDSVINPSGSSIHGALAKHVGLDATTV
jgi:hypothetical protein